MATHTIVEERTSAYAQKLTAYEDREAVTKVRGRTAGTKALALEAVATTRKAKNFIVLVGTDEEAAWR